MKKKPNDSSFGAKLAQVERVMLVLMLALKIATIVVQLAVILRA